MTVTLEIKDDKLELFWKIVQENDLVEAVDPKAIEESHIEEILRQEKDPVLGQFRPWSEARLKYAGKGL